MLYTIAVQYLFQWCRVIAKFMNLSLNNGPQYCSSMIFCCMNRHMFLQHATLSKWFWTFRTAVRFLSSVNSYVIFCLKLTTFYKLNNKRVFLQCVLLNDFSICLMMNMTLHILNTCKVFLQCELLNVGSRTFYVKKWENILDSCNVFLHLEPSHVVSDLLAVQNWENILNSGMVSLPYAFYLHF